MIHAYYCVCCTLSIKFGLILSIMISLIPRHSSTWEWCYHTGILKLSKFNLTCNSQVNAWPVSYPHFLGSKQVVIGITFLCWLIGTQWCNHRSLNIWAIWCQLPSGSPPVDLQSGYWQVELDPKDKEKTAFPIGRGLWHFIVLPLGLANDIVPTTFEWLMEQGLRLSTALIYNYRSMMCRNCLQNNDTTVEDEWL